MKVVIKTYLNIRVGKASVNAPCFQYLAPGSEIEVDGNLYPGDKYEGIDTWYKDEAGNYYWSGGVAKETDTKAIERSAIEIQQRPGLPWWLNDYGIPELWKISKGKGISVAVLDSGLNLNLAEFNNRPQISYYNAVLDSVRKEDCMDDSSGHGSDCAGILCGQGISMYGVAPEINLQVIKITDANGERTTAAILKGLMKAISLKVDVISLSFYIATDPNFENIHKQIQEAYKNNIVVVAAAGDSGGLSFPVNNYPASFPECISAGGVTKDKQRSKYSSMSDFLDLMAPGENLPSVSNPNNPINGTSFSAPYIAGVIALLKAIAKDKNKVVSAAGIFDILKRSANKNIPGGNYNSTEYGWGLIDPVTALRLINLI